MVVLLDHKKYLASSPPYTIPWDSTKVSNGLHVLTAEALLGSPSDSGGLMLRSLGLQGTLAESEKPDIRFANAKSGSDSASDAIADSDEGADTDGHAISASNLGVGLHSLNTTPYIGPNGSGGAGKSMSIIFL